MLSCQTDASTALKKIVLYLKNNIGDSCLPYKGMPNFLPQHTHDPSWRCPRNKGLLTFLEGVMLSHSFIFFCSHWQTQCLITLGSEIIRSENLSYIKEEKATLLENEEDRVKCRWHWYLYNFFNSLVINVHMLFIKKIMKRSICPWFFG